MTYTCYQQNAKPKPQTEGKKGWIRKHGAAGFEPIE